MKGILLAGGSGTRLYPATCAISKQLLPVYDKPMIYYPLSILMLGGIKDILIITTPFDIERYRKLLGNGKQWGLNFSYIEQEKPEGIAQSFILAEDFIKDENICLILGDNIFYGHGIIEKLEAAKMRDKGATVFAYWVKDPERYGVVSFDETDKAIKIEEKPKKPNSNWAITGLYFYDSKVVDFAKKLKPSARGELEISDINQIYLEQENLFVEKLGRGFAWLDTGTHESLIDASNFVEAVEKRQGLKIACIDEIAYRSGFINTEQFKENIKIYSKNDYGKYLKNLLHKK